MKKNRAMNNQTMKQIEIIIKYTTMPNTPDMPTDYDFNNYKQN